MSEDQLVVSELLENLKTFQLSLSERYEMLSGERDGYPIYGIEHGLGEGEINLMRISLSAALRMHGSWTITLCPLPLIAYASEVGYAYEGFFNGYWPHLEARLHFAFGAEERETMTRAFGRAHDRYALAAPDKTIFSENYRHIAWPLTNALAPRQIHAGIAAMLKEALAYGHDDDEDFMRVLRRAIRNTGSPRLVDWSVNDHRLLSVARGLLDEDDSGLSAEVLQRLRIDATTDPEDRRNVQRARRFYVASRGATHQRGRYLIRVHDSAYTLGITQWPTDFEKSSGPLRVGFKSVAAAESWAIQEKIDLPQPRLGDGAKTLFIRDQTMFPETYISLSPADPLVLSDEADLIVLGDHDSRDSGGLSYICDLAGLACSAAPKGGIELRAFLSEAGFSISEPGLQITGGLPLDFGTRYASGVPVAVEIDNKVDDTRLTVTTDDFIHSDEILTVGEVAMLMSNGIGSVDLRADAFGGRTLERSLSFETPEEPEPLIGITVDPASPNIADLVAGRLCVRLLSPFPLKDVPVKACVQRQGFEDVRFDAAIPAVPARLTFQTGALAAIGNWVKALEPRPLSLLLTLDVGVDRVAIPIIEPDPVVSWSKAAEGWQAFLASDDEQSSAEPLSLLSVSHEQPCQLSDETLDDKTTRLLLPVGVSFVNGFVASPPRIKLAGQAFKSDVKQHRNFSRAQSNSASSLEAEIITFIGWSCARVETPIAAFDARGAAETAERSLVSTMCGASWLEIEDSSKMEPFIDTFLKQAQSAPNDPLAITSTDELTPISQADRIAFIEELRTACLSASDLSLTASRAAFDDDDGENLDELIAETWKAVNTRRVGPELSVFNPEIFNETKDWNRVLASAQETVHFLKLNRMIQPTRLARSLLELNYDAVGMSEIAQAIAADRVDLGLLARSGRSLQPDDIKTALLLWMHPRGFAASEWQQVAARLLEDRMTARAVRYAALRLRAESVVSA